MIYEVELSRMGAIRMAFWLLFNAIWHGSVVLRDSSFEGRWIEEEVP